MPPSLPHVLGRTLVVLLLLCPAAWAADPVRVVVITPYPQTFQQATAAFERQFGAGRLDLIVSTTLRCAMLEEAAALYIHGAFWSREMDACAADVQRRQRQGLLVGGTIPAIFQASWRVTASAELTAAAPYLRFGGEANLVGFLGALYNAASRSSALTLTDAAPQAEAGIYHPKAPAPFFSLSQYLAWYRTAALVPEDAPRVGITFFQTNHVFGDLAHVDALIDALERRGIAVIPSYGWPLKASQPFLFDGDRPAIELLFCLNLLMPNPENARFIEEHGVHAINLTTTTETFEQWSSSERGLPPGRVSLQLGTPERTGATQPILIATTRKRPDGSSELVPVPERVESAASRAERWLALRHKENASKRIALIYFNSPPGKGTMGASYLDLFPSLDGILATLARNGYLVGDAMPSAEELQELLMLTGRNVGNYAPGELDALTRSRRVVLLPMSRYERWYRELPQAFRGATEKAWGSPGQSRLMTVRRDGELFFVIPGVQLGNVFLGPQPLRDVVDAAASTAHSDEHPPPHSYIAYYLWLRHTFGADALVHLGRHGTLEWLPGKDVAQSAVDPGEVLIGDLPHFYYYIVDGGGEFLQAKRRSQAVVISHLTPLLAEAGLGPDFAALKAALDNRERLEDEDATLRSEYEEEILREARRLRLFETLNLAPADPLPASSVERIAEYVDEVEEAAIPLGLHAIGRAPSAATLRDAVKQYLLWSFAEPDASRVRPVVDEWAEAILGDRLPASGDTALFDKVRDGAREWAANLEHSADAELDSLITLLAGKTIPTGVSGDPLRVPQAVPTGRNLHDMDPRAFPTKAAWEVGKRLADALLEEQRRKTGRYPETVSLVLWYGESNRTQGIAEAQALRLLGAEPVWNGRGQVDDVKLVAQETLQRPRVDVVLTMSGLYRDGLPEKLDLLDRAVKLAATAPDDSAIRRNAVRVEQQLRAAGVADDLAKQMSLARLFGPAPQAFGTGLNAMMESSQDRNNIRVVADEYLTSMNYAYGQGMWAQNVAGTLAAHLANNTVVVHSRSTNLYGVIDNDETYQFAGGLNAATLVASGRAPDVLISDVRRNGRERLEDMRTFLSRELESRAWNPKWIAGMMTAGYSGAREMARAAENLYGLRATAPAQVDDRAWQQMFDVYIGDKYDMGLAAFFADANPHAQQMLAARLLEIDRQQVHRFSASDRNQLLRTYVASVNRFGVSCYANACANPRLQRYIVDQSRQGTAVSSTALADFERRLQTATAAPVAPEAMAATAASTPAMTMLSIVERIRDTSQRTWPVTYRLDASWLLLLVPALLSPFYAWWRLRTAQWSAGLEAFHR